MRQGSYGGFDRSWGDSFRVAFLIVAAGAGCEWWRDEGQRVGRCNRYLGGFFLASDR